MFQTIISYNLFGLSLTLSALAHWLKMLLALMGKKGRFVLCNFCLVLPRR